LQPFANQHVSRQAYGEGRRAGIPILLFALACPAAKQAKGNVVPPAISRQQQRPCAL
jgi:hypothetical protein